MSPRRGSAPHQSGCASSASALREFQLKSALYSNDFLPLRLVGDPPWAGALQPTTPARGDCWEGALSQCSVVSPVCALAGAAYQSAAPAVCAQLEALRKSVLGSGKGPSDLQGGHFGLCTVAQLLEVSSWPLPAAQLDRPSMPRPQPRSDCVLYAAAAAIWMAHQGALADFWTRAEHPLASLYRLVMARHFGRHKRTQVLPTGAVGVEGGCIGLSQSVDRVPFCSRPTADNRDLVRLIRESLPAEHRCFSFTTVQVNKGLRPKPHRDSANVGASLCVSLGPFTGGVMWQALGQEVLVFEQDAKFLPPWTWGAMDGTCVHSCTPHFGQRVSLVLFTHEVALRPLAEDLVRDATDLGVAATTTTTLQECSALGLRALARVADWRHTNALSETAEAVLQVSELPFSDLHRAVCLPRGDASSAHAFGRVPRVVLMFLLLACHTIGAARASGDCCDQCSEATVGPAGVLPCLPRQMSPTAAPFAPSWPPLGPDGGNCNSGTAAADVASAGRDGCNSGKASGRSWARPTWYEYDEPRRVSMGLGWSEFGLAGFCLRSQL